MYILQVLASTGLVQVYAVPPDTSTWNFAIYWCNVGFTVFFAIETIIKVAVFTPPVSDGHQQIHDCTCYMYMMGIPSYLPCYMYINGV